MTYIHTYIHTCVCVCNAPAHGYIGIYRMVHTMVAETRRNHCICH